MKNRAKCKLCNSIIESFSRTDYVSCKCGEIAIEGGDQLYKTYARDFANFLRIDDEGNEIIVKVESKDKIEPVEINTKPSKHELLEMLDEMRKAVERLPQDAMFTPITHADFCSLIMLLSSILRAED